MSKEEKKIPKQKITRFKETYDEEFSWEEQQETQKRRKKLGKKSQWKKNKKWSKLETSTH